MKPPDRTPRVGGELKPEAAPRTRGPGPNPTSPKPPLQSSKPSLGPRPALPQKPRSSSTRSMGTHTRAPHTHTHAVFIPRLYTLHPAPLSLWFFGSASDESSEPPAGGQKVPSTLRKTPWEKNGSSYPAQSASTSKISTQEGRTLHH